MTQEVTPHPRSLWALDWLNVLVADVKTGVGPYLAIYLQASRHWAPAAIGLAMSAMCFASVMAQIPTGALTDHLHHKRWMIVAAAAVVATGCLWCCTPYYATSLGLKGASGANTIPWRHNSSRMPFPPMPAVR